MTLSGYPNSILHTVYITNENMQLPYDTLFLYPNPNDGLSKEKMVAKDCVSALVTGVY